MFNGSPIDGAVLILMAIGLYVRRDSIGRQVARRFGYNDAQQAGLRDVYAFIAAAAMLCGIILVVRGLAPLWWR